MRQLLKRSCVYSRLFVCLALSVTCLYSIAQATNQHDNTVTLSGTNISLGDIFHAIKLQTGISVMYSKAVTGLDQSDKVSVRFNKTPLDQVLAFLFKGKDLDWSYNDNVVRIHKKENPTVMPVKKSEADSSINSISVTGVVTDAGGVPLPGATIMVKGTSLGTKSDIGGHFSLPKVSSNKSLIISSVGYETREIQVRGKSILAQLNMVVNELDETVVIAYGTTTRRFNTGLVNTVKAEEIEKQPVNNPLQALQGRVPGMVITQQTGVSGGAFSVEIRGRSSINPLVKNDPLYVIDGVPYTSTLLPSQGYGIFGGEPTGTIGNPFNFINPADIESIDILKDADATSIYGSRGANGVVLITTKKGKPGKTKVDINYSQGWGKVTRKMDLLNSQQYLAMRHEAFLNDGVTPDPSNAPDLFNWDTTRYTDWQKLLIGGTANYTDIRASVAGGTDRVQYLVGSSFHRESTVYPGDYADQKVSTHFNLNTLSANKRFRFSMSASYLVDDNRILAADLMQRVFTEPIAPKIYNDDGSLNWAGSTWTNPFAYLKQDFRSKTYNLVANATIGYTILPGLEIKTSLGYTNMRMDQVSKTPLTALDPANWPFSYRTTGFTDNSMTSWIVEPQLSYERRIGQGTFSALLGATVQHNDNAGQLLTGTGYASDQLMGDIKSATQVTVNSTTINTYKYNAGFGRLNYNLLNRYIINLSARRDGSSRFGPGNQFHNFIAAGFAWIFTEENFMKRSVPQMSFGKIRASYGTTGNDQIGDYRFLDLYRSANFSYQGAPGLLISSLFNPNLAWELSRKLELGLELGFFKDRILVTADYYRNRSSNQLIDYALPYLSGFQSVLVNQNALVQNTGIELQVSSSIVKTVHFSWSTAINLTIPRNKLLSYPDLATSSYSNLYEVGKPITIGKVYNYHGVNDSTGVYEFLDKKGIPTQFPGAEDQISINTAPKYYGGVQNTVNFKGFTLDVFFQFVKQIGRNTTSLFVPGFYGGNQPATVLERWQKIGDRTDIQRFSQAFGNEYLAAFFAQYSNLPFKDASFIRLKNVSLSWELPDTWKTKLHLQNGKIYIQGQNLLTITRYQGFDPENQSVSFLPPLRMMTAGINVTF